MQIRKNMLVHKGRYDTKKTVSDYWNTSSPHLFVVFTSHIHCMCPYAGAFVIVGRQACSTRSSSRTAPPVQCLIHRELTSTCIRRKQNRPVRKYLFIRQKYISHVIIKGVFGILLHKQKCFIRSKKIPSPSGFSYLIKNVLRVLNGLKYSSIFNSCFDQS